MNGAVRPFCNGVRNHHRRASALMAKRLLGGMVSRPPALQLQRAGVTRSCTSLSGHPAMFDVHSTILVSQQSKQLKSGFSRAFASSPFDPSKNTTSATSPELFESAARKRQNKFIPRKAAVQLAENARLFFKQLLENPPRPEIVGIMLHYDQSKTGQPRMVFSFGFVTAEDLAANSHRNAERVSLEVLLDKNGNTTPKSPADAWNDGLPKLYVHPNAFLKVLGATLDVDPETVAPILLDRQGHRMDPNA